MPDSIQATPRSSWLGAIADALARVQSQGRQMAESGIDPLGIGNAINLTLGKIPEGLNRMSYGEPMSAPIQETGPDPSIAAKYAPQMDVAGVLPVSKAVVAAKGIAAGLAKMGTLGTMLDRSHLIQLAKTEPETVARLEQARKASLDVAKAGGTPGEAWAAGSAHLEGTPYAGWLPAHGGYPDMFEVSDVGAQLSPRFDPRGSSLIPGQQNVVASVTKKEGPLGESFRHPELEKFMPDLPHWRSEITMGPAEDISGTGGLSYNKELGTWAGVKPLVEAQANNPNALRSTLIHEAGAHGAAIDSSIPRGTNFGKERTLLELQHPNMPPQELDYRAMVNYNNNEGERLARATENRRFLGPTDIRSTSPQFELSSQYDPGKLPRPEDSWWWGMSHDEQKQLLIKSGKDPAAVEAAYAPRPDPNATQPTVQASMPGPFGPESAQLSPLAQLLAQSLPP